MDITTETKPAKRRPVNLTIREDVLEKAKSYQVNASRAAEKGIAQAVRDAQSKEWLKENQQNIQAINTLVENEGLILPPLWLRD